MMFVVFVLCIIFCMQNSVAFRMAPLSKVRTPVSLFSAKEDKPAKMKKVVVTIGKTELLDRLQVTTAFKKVDLERVLNAFYSVIHDEVLHKGAELRLREFGTFKQRKTLPRMGRSLQTGEMVPFKGKTSIAFTPAAGPFILKDEE